MPGFFVLNLNKKNIVAKKQAQPEAPLTKAIVLAAFGENKMYRYAAYNAAFSIKHHLSEAVQIHLITDHPEWCASVFPGTFDRIIPLDGPPVLNGRFDPGYVKVSLYKYLQADISMILDVDVICINDLVPVFNHFIESGKPYMSWLSGSFTKTDGDKSLSVMQWAKAEHVFEHWRLPEDTVVPAINSSLVMVRKSEKAKEVFDIAYDYFVNKPIDNGKIWKAWGKTHPDELYTNAALAKAGVDPSGMQDVIFFNYGKKSLSFKEIKEKYALCSYYGGKGFTNEVYIEWYDELLIKWHYEKAVNPKMKIYRIVDNKYVDQR